MARHEIETDDGSIILVTDEHAGWTWVGAPGFYGPDELRDIADALDNVESRIEDDEDEA